MRIDNSLQHCLPPENPGNLGNLGNSGVTTPPPNFTPKQTALNAFKLQVQAPVGYSFTPSGTIKHSKDRDGQEFDEVICHNPIGIAARSRDHKNSNWAARLVWLDPDNALQEWLVPAEVFSQPREFQALAKDLTRRGVLFDPGAKIQAMLLDFFFQSQIRIDLPRERTAGNLGFLSLENQPLAFVLPDRTLTAAPLPGQEVSPEKIIFRSVTPVPALQAYCRSGELQDWKDVFIHFSGNALIISGIALGLTGPFLSLVGEENCGVHFYGATSCGKTSTAQACASVAGFPGNPARGPKGQSLFQTWNATKNAVEMILAPHSGMTVIIDEVGANDAGINLYNAFSGVSKIRLDDSCGLREQKFWSTLVVSTGEYSCSDHVALANKGRVTDGAAVRMMDVPIEELHRAAYELGLPALPEPKILATQVEQMQRDLLQYYGTALPSLIEKYFQAAARDQFDLTVRLKEDLEDVHEQICAHLKDENFDLNSAQIRAIRRLSLAVVVGQFACEENILPFTSENLTDSILAMAHAWLRSKKFIPIETQVVDSLRTHCLSFQHLMQKDFRDQRISPSAGSPFIYLSAKKLLIFTKDQLLQATQQKSISIVTQALIKMGMLHISVGEKRNDPKIPKSLQDFTSSSRGYFVYADILFKDYFSDLTDVPAPLEGDTPDAIKLPFSF